MYKDFEIVSEDTIKFEDGSICVATIKKNGLSLIEITNSKECICRLDTDKETRKFKNLIINRLETYTNTHVAEFFLKRLSTMSLSEVELILTAEEKFLSSAKVGELLRKLNFKTKSKRGYLGDIKKKGSITINVYSSLKEKPFGRFFGTFLGNDFEFEKI